MSVPKRLYECCVLGCTNEHRSRHNLPSSELRTLWLNFIFEGNIPEKKSVTSPKCLGINTNASCVNVSSIGFPNCLSERASWHSVRLTAKAIIVSVFSLMLPSSATRMIVVLDNATRMTVVVKSCI